MHENVVCFEEIIAREFIIFNFGFPYFSEKTNSSENSFPNEIFNL